MKYLLTLIFLWSSSTGYAQEERILGRIVDAKTNTPLKEANVVVFGSKNKTASNALGYFELKDSLPTRLIISHVGYQTSTLVVSEHTPAIKIALPPKSYALDTLILKGQLYFEDFTYDQVAYDWELQRRTTLQKDTTLIASEVSCAFPGGIGALHRYLASQRSQKKDSLPEAFSAKIAFGVTPEGTLRVDSISGVSKGQAELLGQVFSSSPKWIPALQGQTLVPMQLTQVIEYDPRVELLTDNSKLNASTKVDQGPIYKGGKDEFFRLLWSNLHYPLPARQAHVQGTVIASFVINQTGQVEDIQILKGIGFGCDQEVSRVIKLSSGKWIPAIKDDRPVKARMNLPVKFYTSEKSTTMKHSYR